MKNVAPPEELIKGGSSACAGCMEMLCVRHIMKFLGRKTIAVIPAGCLTITTGDSKNPKFLTPLLHTAFAAAPGTASGLNASQKQLSPQEKINTVVFAGDGSTFDISFAAFSGAIERNDDIIYVCLDNEAYMNTGVQRSSATPLGARTTTTPTGKTQNKKDIMGIVAAHNIPYAASISLGLLSDFEKKVLRAKDIQGFRFLHFFSPCPPGWQYDSKNSIEISQLAVRSKVFPLMEIEDGRITSLYQPPKITSVKEYLATQGRFKHLREEDIARIQDYVDNRWKKLLALKDLA